MGGRPRKDDTENLPSSAGKLDKSENNFGTIVVPQKKAPILSRLCFLLSLVFSVFQVVELEGLEPSTP